MKLVNRTRIPTAAFAPLVRWVHLQVHPAARRANILLMYSKRGGRIGGIANRFGFARGRKGNGLPAGEPLVTITVGPTWHVRDYPYTETYKQRAGSMTYHTWQEHFAALLAHELRHIEQFEILPDERKKIFGHSLEVDAERFAQKVLKLFQAQWTDLVDLKQVMAKPEQKECPKCGYGGEISTLFGYRTIKGGRVIPQSWCHICRRAHARERRGR